MEALGEMQAPRFSFSQDFGVLERIATEMRKREQVAHMAEEEEDGADFSFEFSSSLSLDPPAGHKMLSAEELFFNGKVRPLEKTSAISENREELHQPKELLLSGGKDEVQTQKLAVAGDSHENSAMAAISFSNNLSVTGSSDKNLAMAGASFNENLAMARNLNESLAMAGCGFDQSLAMAGTSLDKSSAMAKKHLRSLNESPRCVSMTIEGSRGHPRRSCISLDSSRCSSPSRTFGSPPSRTFSQPSTTPTSPKNSSQKTSKFMDFFMLRKHRSDSKETLSPPAESCTSTCRLPRSFWPFSRSNSAVESKISPAVSPPPRRSNSAGESKTTSSSLLPITTTLTADNGETQPTSTMASAGKSQIAQSHHKQANKKGLPPLPNRGVKKSSSCLVPANCGYNAVALSSPSVSVYITRATSVPMSGSPSSSHRLIHASIGSRAHMKQLDTVAASTRGHNEDHQTHPYLDSSSSSQGSRATSAPISGLSSSSYRPTHAAIGSRAHLKQSDTITASRRGHNEHHQTHPYLESSSTSQGGRVSASPGRQARRATANSAGRNLAQGSPVWQGAWNSPSRSNASRGAMKNFDRCNKNAGPPKGLVRPKDMLRRDQTSVRVPSVLNVPGCITPSSKSKLFNLGNLFPKKEKADRAYSVLPPTDSQNGG